MNQVINKLSGISPFYPEIVVGSSLSALIYCYFNQVPFISVENEKPILWDYFSPEVDLSVFHMPNQTEPVQTPDGLIHLGQRKCILWEKLYFLLSLHGLNLGTDIFNFIRTDEEQTKLKCITSNNKIEFRYDKLTLFGNSLVPGLGDPTINPDILLKVFDFMNIKKSTFHKIDYIKKETDLGAEYIFFHSVKNPWKRPMKDLVVVSYIYENELNSDKYSEVGLKLSCTNRLRKLLSTPENRLKIKVEHTKRLVQPLEPKYLYPETKKLKIIKTRFDEESLIKKYSKMNIDSSITKTNKLFDKNSWTWPLRWFEVWNNVRKYLSKP